MSGFHPHRAVSATSADRQSRMQDYAAPFTRLPAALDLGASEVICLIADITDNDDIRISGLGRADSLGIKQGVIVDEVGLAKSAAAAISLAEYHAGHKIYLIDVAFSPPAFTRASLRHRGGIAPSLYQQIEAVLAYPGITVNTAIASPLSDCHAVKAHLSHHKDVILLNLGKHRLTASHFAQDQLRHCQSLAIGSDYVTQDIMQAFQLSRHEAESLKCDIGTLLPVSRDHAWQQLTQMTDHDTASSVSAVPAPSEEMQRFIDISMLLPGIITARMEEIFDYAVKLVVDMPTQAPIILTGKGMTLVGIVAFARKYLQRQVMLQPLPRIAGLEFARKSRDYTTALGLIRLAAASIDRKP